MKRSFILILTILILASCLTSCNLSYSFNITNGAGSNTVDAFYTYDTIAETVLVPVEVTVLVYNTIFRPKSVTIYYDTTGKVDLSSREVCSPYGPSKFAWRCIKLDNITVENVTQWSGDSCSLVIYLDRLFRENYITTYDYNSYSNHELVQCKQVQSASGLHDTVIIDALITSITIENKTYKGKYGHAFVEIGYSTGYISRFEFDKIGDAYLWTGSSPTIYFDQSDISIYLF